MVTKIGKVSDKSRANLTGGSRKGVPNKVTADLKDMILGALDAAGGVQYLTERAADPKTAGAFLTLVGKTLPMTVKGPGENGEHIFQKIVVEVVKAK
tara:strand:- start:15819 stop:16109 length:291 start_codon:yes stop_codon:yes gene_type:complete